MNFRKPPEWNDLMEGVVRQEYELLTGAGFSWGVKDAQGSKLPMAEALGDELTKAFGLPTASDPTRKPSLPQIYSLCKSRGKDASGRDVHDWLKRRFARTTPPQWYSLLGDMHFSNIWTFNIDDGLESALGDAVRSFHYTDSTFTAGPGVTPLIHLHGQAARYERGIIFSLAEYARNIREPRSFVLRFNEVISGRPLIIVGASIATEADIAAALSQRASTSSSTPSVIVRPHFDEFSRAEAENWGFIPIEATAEAFFRAIHADLESTGRKLAPVLAGESHSSPLSSRFARQWVTPEAVRPPKGNRFLSGDAPSYADVRSHNTSFRTFENQIFEELSTGSGLVLLKGTLYGGKSTTALRVAKRFADENWNVYTYQGEENIDSRATIGAISKYPNTLLLVDDAGLYSASIIELVENARSRGVALHLIAIDRTGPASRLMRHSLFEEFTCPVKLDKVELDAYINLLRSRDLLNETWRRKKPGEFSTSAKADYVSIINDCTIGHSLTRRASIDVRSLESETLKSALLLACIFSRVSRGVDLSMAASSLRMSPQELEDEVRLSPAMDSIVRIERGVLRPRHHRLAELLIDSDLLRSSSLSTVIEFARALAARVDPGAIKNNTKYYRMAATLLDHEELAKLVGRNDVEAVYEAIEPEFTWNSRYWEQRALGAAKRVRFEEASEWARRAVNVHRDAYSLNTYATVLFKYVDSGQVHNDQLSQIVDWAIEAVTEARKTSRDDSEYPYVNFLTRAPFLYGLALDGKLHNYNTQQLVAAYTEWERMAIESKAFNYEGGRKKLTDFRSAWNLAVS